MTDSLQLERGNWSESNYESLLEMLNGPPGLAVFDFDNTLIYNDLGEAVMYYLALQGMIRADRSEFWNELVRITPLQGGELERMRVCWQAFAAQEDEAAYLQFVDVLLQLYERVYTDQGLAAAYRWTALLFAWHPVNELIKIARHVFAAEQEEQPATVRLPSGQTYRVGIRVYPEIHNLIQVMRQKQWSVRIVTASPRELIAAVIDHWNLPADAVLGMHLERNETGVIQPVVREPLPFQQGKVDLLRTAESAELSFAAGDSPGDLTLLQTARTALLIDRDYPEVKKALASDSVLIQRPFLQYA